MRRYISFVLSINLVLFFCCALIVKAETPTIIDNAPALDRSQNLVFNGSFEVPHLSGGFEVPIFLESVDGDGYYFIIDVSDNEPYAVPDGWTTSGGGPLTYARWGNNIIAAVAGSPILGQANSDPNINGVRTIYMGNYWIQEVSETPVFMPNGEVIFSEPPDFVLRPGYDEPVKVKTTAKRLVEGGTYRMSFWNAGEWGEGFPELVRSDGIMGVQIEGYDILYVTVPSGDTIEAACCPHVFGDEPSHVYTIEFIAVDSQIDITLINWGHFVPETSSSVPTMGWTNSVTPEVVIDDVILNLVSLPPAQVPTFSEWGLVITAVLFGIAGLFVIRKRKLSAA